MRVWIGAVVLVLAVAFVSPAKAAQRTELVSFLHMDAEVGYDGDVQFGKLREQDTNTEWVEVAKYNHQHHQMNIDIEFGICPWLELDLRFPIVFMDRQLFKSSRGMTYDVQDDRATMLDSTLLTEDQLPDIKRAGFGDMWIGLQFSPFNETYERFTSPATLLVEAAISPPSGKSRSMRERTGFVFARR